MTGRRAGRGAGRGARAAAPGAATAPAGVIAPVADGASSAPFALGPDGPAAALSVRLAPGATRAVGLRVANAGARPRSFALRASSPWVVLPAAVTVPPRQSAPVAALVTVPPGASPGPHLVRVGALAAGPADAALAVAYESAVRLRVTVAAP